MDLFESEDMLKRELWVFLKGEWHYWISCLSFYAAEEAAQAAQSGFTVMVVKGAEPGWFSERSWAY